MATWSFSDGTVLLSGGEVVGGSELADSLRHAIAYAKSGEGWPVSVALPPGGSWPLDVHSDFTLNALAQEEAWRPVRHLAEPKVITDYAEGDDVPAEVHTMRARESVAGRIY
jgi:hypothetical protein